ncbi:MAG: ABC transporter ATP-binding protein [Chloroflexi bacterium]|nr:ABC transporter ATP-binding protein [Chloroflexota bacterium]
MTPLLSVRNLKTHFFLDEGVVKAVDGVDFDVFPGQVVGIVGESGCGKSVTIKSVMQLIQKPGRIIDGQILFRHHDEAGRETIIDLAQLDPHGKTIRSIRGAEIALIPQEPMASFSPVHTIGDQIMEAILLHLDVDEEEARRIAVERLHEVGMPNPEQRLNAYSWELSGGLRQRAMIAMSLACNPRLLIADEPTTAIDVTTQAQVLNLLLTLQKQHNMAIIFITHDLGVIAQIADFVVVMYLGRVMESGPVEDIFFNPQHPYTKALLESIPSIYAPAGKRLPTIEGSIPHPFSRPSGCPFHPRCKAFMPGVCNAAIPKLKAINDRQSVSCFLYDHAPAIVEGS